MDLTALSAAVQHNGYAMTAVGFAAGLAFANYALIVRKIVHSAWVMKAIQKDPALAKEIVAELKKDVDEVADATPPAAPGPKP